MARHIVRWDPFREMFSLRDEIDRLFNEFLGRVPAETEGGWLPAMDVEETDDAFIVTAEIPGMSKDEIKLSLQGDSLVIQGEKKREKEEKDRTFHRIERVFGKFQRVITLPTKVDADKVKASYKDGVLTITLPKSEEVKPKEITISVK